MDFQHPYEPCVYEWAETCWGSLTRFASGFGHDEVVETVVLNETNKCDEIQWAAGRNTTATHTLVTETTSYSLCSPFLDRLIFGIIKNDVYAGLFLSDPKTMEVPNVQFYYWAVKIGSMLYWGQYHPSSCVSMEVKSCEPTSLGAALLSVSTWLFSVTLGQGHKD